jgi:hypothetical protein
MERGQGLPAGHRHHGRPDRRLTHHGRKSFHYNRPTGM